MTFIQVQFLLFLLISAIVFYICPVKHRWIVLLGSSIVFYAIAGLNYLPFIFVTSFTVYLSGRKMGQIYEQMDIDAAADGLGRKEIKAIKDAAKKKAWKYVLLALILNVGILIVVKFTKFAVDPINAMLTALGQQGNFSAAWIIMPLGISYYTFSCLSYLLDVYWKREKYEPNYARFLLYAIYFPHILQGPIERYGRLGQRLKGEFRWDYDRVCKGLQLMMYGYFKKLVIADRINIYTDAVYAETSNAYGVIYLIAFFLDIVYIYADFSGCMDIARGASEIFGVELDLNFDHPFGTTSITEFWRHWHMSLGGWFKDYVYYPISTSKFVKNLNKSCKKKFGDTIARAVITLIPVFVTWVLTGLWHGTGSTYLAWGIYYSIMIFISVTFGEMFHSWAVKLHIDTTKWSWKLFQMIRTTCIFGGGRMLTRPGTLYLGVHSMGSALFKWNPWSLTDGRIFEYGLDQTNFTLLIVAILVFGFISYLQTHSEIRVRDMIAQQNLLFRWLIYIVAFFTIIIFGIYGSGYSASSFVYMAY